MIQPSILSFHSVMLLGLGERGMSNIYLHIYLPIDLSIYLPIYLSTMYLYLFIYLFIYVKGTTIDINYYK